MKLRRFEVGNIPFDDGYVTEGILSHPTSFIDMNMDEHIYLKWIAIFEDKLPAPPSDIFLANKGNTISLFTESGYRKFRSHLRWMKSYIEDQTEYTWIRKEYEIPAEDVCKPIYKDSLQMLFNLDDWNRYIEGENKND